MIEKGYQSVIDLIFSNSWDITFSLIWAVSKRDNKVLKLILDGGADVNTVGNVRMQYGIRCVNDFIDVLSRYFHKHLYTAYYRMVHRHCMCQSAKEHCRLWKCY